MSLTLRSPARTGCVPAAESLRYQRLLNKEQRLLPSEPGGQSRGFVLNDSFAGRVGVGGWWLGRGWGWGGMGECGEEEEGA